MSTIGSEMRFLRGLSAKCGVTAGIAKNSALTLESSPTNCAEVIGEPVDLSCGDVGQHRRRMGMDDRDTRYRATIRAACGDRSVVDDGGTDPKAADQPDVSRVQRIALGGTLESAFSIPKRKSNRAADWPKGQVVRPGACSRVVPIDLAAADWLAAQTSAVWQLLVDQTT